MMTRMKTPARGSLAAGERGIVIVPTYNESEKTLLTWDKQEELTGMELACQFINEQICPQI